MEVVALVPGREHVCARYRIRQFAGHLRSAGLQLTLEALSPTFAGRVRQLARRRRDKLVLLVRKLLPVWQLALLRGSTDWLAYDFDDAVYLRDSFHPRGPYSLTRSIRFQATVAFADLVIAGNQHLADEAVRRGARGKVEVIPTCVDPSRYPLADHVDQQPTRLVWIGSKGTLPALEDAREVLEAIGQAVPNTVLRIICDRFPQFKHLRVEQARWSEATELTDLSGADIGISWMPDDAYSRGKCGLKVLQYMAAGLPVVASPVGVHPQLLPSAAGFLPRNSAEWVGRIRELAANSRLREEMGRHGRERLERTFHVDAWGPELAGRLKEVAARL